MDKPQFIYVSYIATTPEKLWNALIDPAEESFNPLARLLPSRLYRRTSGLRRGRKSLCHWSS
jgi:hypothetical protein